jgi:geranylgeranylglycerol-phosphate geranylgeranyltransferase
MVLRAARALFQLTRAEMATFAFIAVFLSLALSSRNIGYSLRMSVPLLPICMCGFVANNLHDIEKDRENHPDRPLASGTVSVLGGATIFFALLAVALTSVRWLIPPYSVFPYLLGLIALINYNYVVFYFPYLKNAYVAAAGTIPFLLLASLPVAPKFRWVTVAALILFLFGIEILSDTEDSKGDGLTLVNRVGLSGSQRIAFCSKLLADIALLASWPSLAGRVLALALLLSDLLFWLFWHRGYQHRAIITLMKLQLIAGLYYLLFP